MEAETIVLGKAYECKPVGLESRVIGEVVRKMERCAVLHVIRYEETDHDELEERCGRVVAKYNEIYQPALVDCFSSYGLIPIKRSHARKPIPLTKGLFLGSSLFF
ncbi:hypothetical protein ACR76W_00260 [Enterococcus casseliflavus]|uniref:hypothetical protein n=2 Tax=Enterococcus TaxID=1350 RepID=UPI003DA29D4A